MNEYNKSMGERQQRSTGRNSDTIASFLLKTYEILEHPENRKIISWDKDDVGFIVLDVISFTREILPKYFRHSNFSSFVRQLNMYDFHKVKQENDMLVFKNPLFCRGEQHKLRFIKRKAAKKTGTHRRYYGNDRLDLERAPSAYRWLKRATEMEINHSCVFFEKTLDLLNDNNHAMSQKQARIEEFTGAGEEVRLDCLYTLREECEVQLSRTINWLDEYLETFRRKLKTLGNFNAQLAQNRREEEGRAAESKAGPEERGFAEERGPVSGET